MFIKARGCLALILTTGLFVCFAGPSQVRAAESDSTTASKPDSATTVKKTLRHEKSEAPRKSGKAASKSSESQRPDKAEVVDATGSVTLPASVANANAQLTSDVSADNASAMSARASTLLAAGGKPDDAKPAGEADVVDSDQLNELDRALQESQSLPTQPPQAEPQKQTVAAASAKPAQAAIVSSDSSTWDRTSLIGKIFIAAGALLTMASAARMFMA
jgi:hypothetical protein